MSHLKKSFVSLMALCCGHLLLAQEVGTTGTKNPFTFSGNVGVMTNFYSSNETFKTRPSFSWNTYGNLEGKTGKLLLPLYFIVNQFNNSNSSPNIQIGISPTYEWARLHVGYRYIPFSPLTFEGQSFRGVGIELYPKQFRFAAFYGRLNKAINQDTSSGSFRTPQYSRTGYGIKAGIGNASRFIDLLYFHAKDDSSSATVIRSSSGNSLKAQENAVVGTSFKLTISKKWIWTGDASVSGLIQDLSGKRSFDSSNQSLKNFMSNFLPDSSDISAHYAAQSSLIFYTPIFSSNLSYRRVQPGFKSLGTPYMVDDVELISFLNNFSVAKGKVNVSTQLSQQHNNLSKSLEAELRTQVATMNVNAIAGQHLNVNLNYSGYNLKQRNDRNSLPDSLRLNDTVLLNQRISQYGISPTYNFTKGNKLHFFSGNANFQVLKDKNTTTAKQNNSNNFSSSLNYTLSLVDKYYSFSLMGIYSEYKQENNSYTSFGPTIGVSAQLLKDKNLNLQANIGLLSNNFNNGTKQKNTTYTVSSTYHVKKHAFNFFINYVYTPTNTINNAINLAVPYSVTTKNMYGGLTYNYTF